MASRYKQQQGKHWKTILIIFCRIWSKICESVNHRKNSLEQSQPHAYCILLAFQYFSCQGSLYFYRDVASFAERQKIARIWPISLTLSWRRSLSYTSQFIDLQSKSIDWILYDMDLRHERVKFSLDGDDEGLVHLQQHSTNIIRKQFHNVKQQSTLDRQLSDEWIELNNFIGNYFYTKTRKITHKKITVNFN